MDYVHRHIVNYFPVVILCLVLSFSKNAHSQEIKALKIETEITIDGKLDEPVWERAETAANFIQFEPVYGADSQFKTEVKALYDGYMIYFGFVCSDPDIQKISAKITQRDGSVTEDDAVGVMLDTFNDSNNAYYFIVNSLGTQLDGKLADNGKTEDITWDTNWNSAAYIHESGWTAEIGIPFSSVRYDKKTDTWGFNAERVIPRNLEMSFLIPGLIDPFRISQFGSLTNLQLDEIATKQFTLIPYGQSQMQENEKSDGNFGIDVQYNPASNFTLDATVNPDFATIEADVEQVNLTRFELSYPEKRPFFLEGKENYSTRIKQFYSRRIGKIPWGIKLNGKLNKWKINILSTESDPATASAQFEAGNDANYTVFRVNREIGKGSNMGLLGANRMFLDKNSGSIGLVSSLFFSELYSITSQLIKSYGEADKGAWTFFLRPSYDSQNAHFHVRYTHVGEGIMENINPVGFIQDDDRREWDTDIIKTLWLNRYGIESINQFINFNQYWSQKGTLRSWENKNKLTIKFLKKWEFLLQYNEEFKRFEKKFRNRLVEESLTYDTKTGNSISVSYGKGKNFDSDLEEITCSIEAKLIEGWNVKYSFIKFWLNPDFKDRNSWIHTVISTYYLNTDLYFKLFYQTRYKPDRGLADPRYKLDRETVQFIFVWRVLPPFGSIQLAYQQGTARYTDIENQGKTLFSKISWVF